MRGEEGGRRTGKIEESKGEERRGWLAGLHGVPLGLPWPDRASVFIKESPVCMTATETLVSSRVMKTDDCPQDPVKRNKKAEG